MNADTVNQKFYGQAGSTETQQATRFRVHWICKQARGQRVLDVGCSQGIVSILLAREGFEVVGIDIEEESINYAQSELDRESALVRDKVKFLLHGCTDINKDLGTFDTVIAGEILEHFSHPEILLHDIYQALNDDGTLVVTVPYGLMNFHDHKQSFYILSLMEYLERYFITDKLEIKYKYILYTGTKREITLTDLNSVYSIERLIQWMKLEEEAFLEIEKNHDYLQSQRKNLYDRSVEKIKKLEEDITKSREIKHMVELTNNEIKEKLSKVRDQSEGIREIKKELSKIGDQSNQIKEYQRRLKVLQTTTTLRHSIGNEIIKAGKSWKAALRLPLTMYRLYKNRYKLLDNANMLQLKETNKLSATSESMFEIYKFKVPGKTIIFMPTNGAGLGHLTRLLAVARRLKKSFSDLNIIFFSTSLAVPLIQREGFLSYYLPTKLLYPKETSSEQWNFLLNQQLRFILNMHPCDMLVFDGATPYAGLISSVNKERDIKTVWIQRGQFKANIKERLVEKEKYFDQIVIPGEAGDKDVTVKDRYIRVNPVIYLGKSELIDDDYIRKQWQIPLDSKIAYVQLGAGNINDINSTISQLLSVLGERDDIYVVLGESIIGQRIDIARERVIVIRDYPNSRYFKAFDFAVSAAGYNSYHELLYFGVPTIFVPNTNTKADDQVSRARNAQEAGAAIMLLNPSTKDFRLAVNKILDKETNESMRTRAQSFVKKNGADEIAEYLSGLIGG